MPKGNKPARKASKGGTTVTSSREFASAVCEAAKGEGVNVATYLDRHFLPLAKQLAARALQDRLNKLSAAGA